MGFDIHLIDDEGKRVNDGWNKYTNLTYNFSCDNCMINMKSCCSEKCKNLTESKSVPLRPFLVSRSNINCQIL